MSNDVLDDQIERIRRGDEPALAGLIARQMPAIRGLAARAVCPGLEFDDAVQEGIIGLFHAIETYDAAKGAGFSTYAGVCVQNAIAGAARAARRRKHAPLNTAVPYEAAGAAGAPLDPEAQVLASERYSQTMHSIDTRLSALEKQVLALFLDGLSYGDIAKRLSVTPKAVDNALQRVRAKLK